MATQVGLDVVDATRSLKSLTSSVKASTSAWKAQETLLKSSGDYLEAAQAKYKGLGEAIGKQSTKLETLKAKQKAVNTETQDGKDAYNKYADQINKAEVKLNSMTQQQQRAGESVKVQKSGIVDLNNSMRSAEELSKSYVERLKAEGRESEALKTQRNGLREQQEKLGQAYKAQERLIDELSRSENTSNETLNKHKIRLNELATQMAQTKTKTSELTREIGDAPKMTWAESIKSHLKHMVTGTAEAQRGVSGLDNKMSGLSGVSSVASQKLGTFKEKLSLGAVAGMASNAIQNVVGGLTDMVSEAAATSDAMDKFKATMKGGGFGDKEIDKVSKAMKKYADQTVYDTTTVMNTTAQLAANGVGDYTKLTQAAGNMNAQFGGSADTFKSVAMVMTQTAGASKLTTENWNQLADAIPGASGKLQDAMRKNKAFTGNFRDAMAEGKISAKEFNKAITDLGMDKEAKKAAKSTSTWEGAIGSLQATINNGLVAAMDKIGKKRMTDIINQIGKAVEVAFEKLVDVIDYLGKHADQVKLFGKILLGAFASAKLIKGMQSVVRLGSRMVFKPKVDGDGAKRQLTLLSKAVRGTARGIGKSIAWTAKIAWKGAKGAVTLLAKGLKGSAIGIGKVLKWTAHIAVSGAKLALTGLIKTVGLVGKGFKALTKIIAANPFIAIATAVIAIGVALVELYKHNKKFRKFVNGIAKAAKSAFKAIGGWINKWFIKPFKNAIKWVRKLGKSVGKGFKSMTKGVKSATKKVTKGFSDMSKKSAKAVKSMFSKASRKFKSGWKSLGKFAKSGASTVGKWYKSMKSKTAKQVKSMMKNQPKLFKKGFKVMGDATQTWKDLMTGKWSRLGKDVKKLTKDLVKVVKSLFSGFYKYINKLTGGKLGELLKTFRSIMTKIKTAWSNMWNSLEGVVKKIWKGVKTVVGKGLNGVIGVINGGIGGVNYVIGKFGGNKDAIKKINKVKYATGTGYFSQQRRPILKPTLAMLNDGNDSPETGNREMLLHPNGATELVQGRNVTRFLAPGTEVINASETRAMMTGRYASGTGLLGDIWHTVSNSVGKAVKGAVNFGKKAFSGMKNIFGTAMKIVASPSKYLDGLIKKPSGNSDVMDEFAGGIYNGVKKSAGDFWGSLWKQASNELNGGAGGNWLHSPGPGWSTGSTGQNFGDGRKGGTHDGVDFGAALGTVFRAMHGGKVTRAGSPVWAEDQLGKVITVKSSDGFQEIYQEFGGMKNIKAKVGDVVKTGDPLGTLGPLNGAGSGAHLHVGVAKGSLWDHGGTSTKGWYDITKMHGKSDGSSNKDTKSNGPLDKLVKNTVGNGFFKFISKLGSMFGDFGETGDGGGSITREMIAKAMDKMKVPTAIRGKISNAIMKVAISESGNRSIMQGIHDVNSGGNETRGPLQYTPGTFASYALPGHKNIMDPYDQVLAYLNNSDYKNAAGNTAIWGKHKFDWLHSGPQGHRRFANGGLVDTHQLVEIAEGNQPEMVIPLDKMKRSRAWTLVGDVVNKFASEGDKVNASTDMTETNNKLDNLIAVVTQLLGVNMSQVDAIKKSAFDKTQLYKRQALDQAIKNYQTF